MPPRNSNPKKSKGLQSTSLRKKCWACGLSVTALATKIGKSRCAVYFAWENPARYPVTFQLIQKTLAQ